MAATEWNDVKDTSSIEALRGFVARYKDDQVYAPLARDRLDALERQQKAALDKANGDRIAAEQRKKEEAEKAEKKRIAAATEAKQRADQEQARAELEAKRKVEEARQAALPSTTVQPSARSGDAQTMSMPGLVITPPTPPVDQKNRQQVKAATEKEPAVSNFGYGWVASQKFQSCRQVYVSCKYTSRDMRGNCDALYSACKTSGCWKTTTQRACGLARL